MASHGGLVFCWIGIGLDDLCFVPLVCALTGARTLKR
jgi:hypothetical protein